MSHLPVIRGVPTGLELERIHRESRNQTLAYAAIGLSVIGFIILGTASPESLPGETLAKLNEWLRLLTTPPEISLTPGIIATLRQLVV